MQTLTACPGTSHWQEGVPAVLLLKIYNPLRSLRIFYKSTHSLYLQQPSCKITEFGCTPGTIKTFNWSLFKSVIGINCKRVRWLLHCLTLIEICLLKIWYEPFIWAQGDGGRNTRVFCDWKNVFFSHQIWWRFLQIYPELNNGRC